MVSSEYDNYHRLPLCLYPLGVVKKKKIKENNSKKLMPNKYELETKNEYKIWV